MILETVLFASVFVYLLWASITDIKYRIMYDYGTYLFGSIFIIIKIIYSIDLNSFEPILTSIYYFIPTSILSYLLYRLGGWGGGDFKLLSALSIAIPYSSNNPHFFIDFLTNTVVFSMIFSLAWGTFLLIRRLDKVLLNLGLFDLFINSSLLLFGIFAFLLGGFWSFVSPFILVLPLVYTISKNEEILQAVYRSSDELEPGDWIYGVVKVGGKEIRRRPTGLSEEEIELIKRSKIKRIKVKDGVPFVPGFFLGFLATYFFGNVIHSVVYYLITSI